MTFILILFDQAVAIIFRQMSLWFAKPICCSFATRNQYKVTTLMILLNKEDKHHVK